MSKPIIWSNGGGTQSAAIAVLISQGKLPVPERAVIADTGRECASTWAYLDNHIRPLLWKVGLEVEIVPHSYATADLYYGETVLLPAYTQNAAKLRGFCSGRWKRDAVHKWLREPERGYGRKNPIIQWLGMSRDEIRRCKASNVKWIEIQWPLVMGYGLTLTRAMCVWVVESAGLPTPPKSRCWMCPHQNDSEWLELPPEEFEQAANLEAEVSAKDEMGGLFLHRSAVPLRQVQFESKTNELPLFQTDCESGLCWI
jgi:3'-phosphoadenosine 5'-phosphosulfate sulfotransferase (PAPS reductase)/FAD synthetase